MDWRIAAHPTPKYSESKNPVENFSPRMFGILLIDYLSKDQTINNEYYSSLLVQLKNILKEKLLGKFTKRVFFFCTTLPRLTGHLQPIRNWPTWDSTVLIKNSILHIWPRRTIYHLFPRLKKTIESSAFCVRIRGLFCRGNLVGRTTFWIIFSRLRI